MKLLKLSVIVAVCLFIAACSGGSYVITIGEIGHNSSSIYGDYEKYNGEYFKKFKAEEGDTITFTISKKTDEGSIEFLLYDSEGELITNIDTNTDIKIKKDDTYKVVVEGNNHKGSFNISWDEQ